MGSQFYKHSFSCFSVTKIKITKYNIHEAEAYKYA